MVGYQEINLMPGQFIFGRKKASKELKMSERTIRTCLKTLENIGNVTTKATNKFSIVSVINWDIYQSENITTDHQSDQQPTNNRPTSDQQVTTNKNVKNNKNVKEQYAWLDYELWKDFRKHRQKLKAPMTNRAEKTILEKLNKIDSGQDPNQYILKSIECGWKGVFPDDRIKTNNRGQEERVDGGSNKYSHLG